MSITYFDNDDNAQHESAVHPALKRHFDKKRISEQNRLASESEMPAMDCPYFPAQAHPHDIDAWKMTAITLTEMYDSKCAECKSLKIGSYRAAMALLCTMVVIFLLLMRLMQIGEVQTEQIQSASEGTRESYIISGPAGLDIPTSGGAGDGFTRPAIYWPLYGSFEPVTPVPEMAFPHSQGAGGQAFSTSVVAPIDLLANPDIASPEAPAPTLTMYRITHYGPPLFPATNQVARGGTVSMWLQLAYDRGYDGICAVSPGTPWYDRVRDDMPPILDVQGHGVYLAVDRMAAWIQGTVDIYEVDQQGAMYAHDKIVVEMEEENDEYNHTN